MKKSLDNPDRSSLSKRDCSNCGNTGTGKFCSSCGQKYSDLNKPVKELLHELLDSLDLDKRLLKTFIPFILKPGHLALEYLAGRRKSYTSPLRLYLIMSLIFFFLAQHNIQHFSSWPHDGIIARPPGNLQDKQQTQNGCEAQCQKPGC